jgi:hypothetical protein
LPPKKPEVITEKKIIPKPAIPPPAKPKISKTPPVEVKKEVIALDTIKAGRITSAPPAEAIVISKNSRIKSGPENKNGHAVLMNISRIMHIAIYEAGATDNSPTKDVFPVGLDLHKVELKPGNYRLVYMLYGYQLGLDFTVEQGKETQVWLAQ